MVLRLREHFKWLLGNPFVYDYVRPALLGGIDYSRAYALLQNEPSDVIVDVGCGTGDGLNYLRNFSSYHGFDIDERAVAALRKRFRTGADAERIHAHVRLISKADLDSIKPNKAVLGGVLHHLSDSQIAGLFDILAHGGYVRQVLTTDVIFLEGKPMNNFLARMDRGDFVRTREAYLALWRNGDFRVVTEYLDDSHLFACYFIMLLQRR